MDGLVADGSEDKGASPPDRQGPQRATDDDNGVFKAGVPISVVPDDGEWSINAQAKVVEETPAQLDSTAESITELPARDASTIDNGGEVPHEDSEPVYERRASESFNPEKREYGEMPVALGDVVYAFETLAQNGWVYGYKHDEHDEVSDQGWLPAAILVPLDTDLDWKGSRRRKGDNGGRAGRSGRGATASEDGTQRPAKPARAGRGGNRGRDAGDGDEGAGRGQAKAAPKSNTKGGAKAGNTKGSGRGKHSSGV